MTQRGAQRSITLLVLGVLSTGLIDPAFDTYYPRPDEVAFPGQLDGWSHLLLFYAESSAFVQFTPENDYRFDVHLRDKLADGWDLTVNFAVE